MRGYGGGGYFRLILSEYARAAGASLRSGKEDTRTDIERQVEQAARWLTLQHDKSISIDELAQKLGYHRTYLSKMFRKQMGNPRCNFCCASGWSGRGRCC